MSAINRRLGIQQRILPNYRGPFFNALGADCGQGLGVFAGLPRPVEAVESLRELDNAQFTPAKNRHLFSGPLYFCYQGGLTAWLYDFDPDVLILEANPRYLSAPQAIRWARRRGRGLIAWGLGAPRGNTWIDLMQRAAWQRFLAQFDTLIAYSAQGAQEYASLGFPQERIIVAPNAVSPRPTWPFPQRPAFDQQDPPVILAVGRLQARKRIDLLLQACAALPAPLQPQVWIVGDGPERGALEALARQIYPQARFWGALFGADLETLFRQAHLFVLPGTGGLAVQQAMSYGLPVIVAEADGTQGSLVRPQTGWLIRPGDLDMLVQTLTEALQSATRLQTMGAAAYQIIQTDINLEAMLAAFARAVAITPGGAR